jgi:lysine biosynthesis protein LysW
MATCPECDAEIEVDKDDAEEMEIGDPWDCDACGSRLRVANLDPLEFESDDDDDDDEEAAAKDDDAEADDEDDDDDEDGDADADDEEGGGGGGGEWEE